MKLRRTIPEYAFFDKLKHIINVELAWTIIHKTSKYELIVPKTSAYWQLDLNMFNLAIIGDPPPKNLPVQHEVYNILGMLCLIPLAFKLIDNSYVLSFTIFSLVVLIFTLVARILTLNQLEQMSKEYFNIFIKNWP